MPARAPSVVEAVSDEHCRALRVNRPGFIEQLEKLSTAVVRRGKSRPFEERTSGPDTGLLPEEESSFGAEFGRAVRFERGRVGQHGCRLEPRFVLEHPRSENGLVRGDRFVQRIEHGLAQRNEFRTVDVEL